MNGKCEWLQLCITRIRDQRHLIFGEKLLRLKIIKSSKPREELKWTNQPGFEIIQFNSNNTRSSINLLFYLSSGLNKEDHIIIAQVGFHIAIRAPHNVDVLPTRDRDRVWPSANKFENYWKRLGEMEKRRVGTRFIDRVATEEDQAKPLMQILAEQGINCSIIWHN